MLRMLAEKVRAWSVGTSVAARPTPELAVLALLLEIARADHEFDPVERHRVKEAAASVLGLTEDEAQALLGVAEQRVEDSISLDEFTSVLNDTLTLADKRRCLVALWRVALADGRLSRRTPRPIRGICAPEARRLAPSFPRRLHSGQARGRGPLSEVQASVPGTGSPSSMAEMSWSSSSIRVVKCSPRRERSALSCFRVFSSAPS